MQPDSNDDQQRQEKIKAEFIEANKPTPKWKQSASEIASDIADRFFSVTSLHHADLRRQIIKAIEDEREVTKHYMTQMGRFWEKYLSSYTKRVSLTVSSTD